MPRQLHRTAAVAVAAALALGGLAAAPTIAYSADDDAVRLFTLDAADAASVSDLDVVEAGDGDIVVLGDASTGDALEDRGIEPLAVELYGDSITADASRASRLAATAYPVPERLAGTDYETYFGGYRTVDSYEQFAHDLAGAYPEVAELVDFGDSWLKTQGRGGHDLLALRLTADVEEQPAPTDGQEGRPRFVLVAQAHAREVITSELAWRYATELLDGYGTDPQITSLLDSTEVWINFQNNPDGIEIVEDALATAPVNAAGDATPPSTSKAWQRKNLDDALFNPTSGNWSSQQPGVDLNRNWGFHWGEASSSANPTSATYRGTAPHSEPEIDALSGLLTDLFGEYPAETESPAPSDRTGTYVNLHSYSDYVIYPYAYSAAANVPNLAPIKANAFRQSYASGFNTGKAGEILYDNSGNDIDWIYSQLGVPAYTYEIGTSRTGGFFPAYSRVDAFWNSVGPGIRFAAEASYEPYTAALGGIVEDLVVERGEGGSVKVTGVASDDRYGANPSSLIRRPAITDIVAVEAALAVDRAGIDETVPLTLAGSGSTVGFSGSIPVTADTAEARSLFVRSKNGSGEWGPWQSATVPLVETTTTVTNTGRAFTAAVTPSSTGPVATAGTVQFTLDDVPVGAPVPVKHGVARTAIPAHLGDGVVTAGYSGDGYYATSAGSGAAGRGSSR
ncbi:M14 family metallopeptidase [Agromyces sp. SYSU K20354]|uniref:M14 family metallopeptidase n=1 Tax=Agromyces cavernae TaxID=2898659 RepID=UPI001E576641|nr:M14 family metallopeptidase [Agromyces cavernae]MCD2441417.1 M14 family metallopeptidase [Agromyces cavernae]